MQPQEIHTYTSSEYRNGSSPSSRPKPENADIFSSSAPSLETMLQQVFPSSSEENTRNKTRRLLGQAARNFTDDQIDTIVTEFQYLINTWLDEYEKQVFSGMTLKEVLSEKL